MVRLWGRKEKEEEKKEELKPFSLEDEINKYSEKMRPFLDKYGGWIHPNDHIDGIKRRMNVSSEKQEQIKIYQQPTNEEIENYILARGTIEEIKNHWEKHYSNLKDVDGIKLANALRDIYRKRLMWETRGTQNVISEEEALELFPILEEQIYS